MLSLGPLAFSAPWVLAGLLALPLIWWLLRITPPAPRSLRFPAIRLLFGLESERQTPRSSPLWLVILRLLAVTALILGLSGPLIGPGGALSGSGPVLLIVDNGWASAADWNRRMSAAEVIVDRAERENRPIAFLATARDEAGQLPTIAGPFNAAAAATCTAAGIWCHFWRIDSNSV
ncbi:MAG: BatA domain-containing protein, partial [Alphaproteobacteria bacterium]